MYERQFGLRDRPFEDRADTRFLYETAALRQVLSALEATARSGGGSCLLLGEPGTGKTLAVRSLLSRIDPADYVVVVTCPAGRPFELIRETCKAFGITLPQDADTQRLMSRLHKHFLAVRQGGQRSVLIVDKAENLERTGISELFAFLGYTGIDREGQRGCLSLVIVGQPCLVPAWDALGTQQEGKLPATRCELPVLTRQETGAYIRHRLRAAGAVNDKLFEESAIGVIHEVSGGNPRWINRICDSSLAAAYAAGEELASEAIVREVVARRIERNLDPPVPGWSAASPNAVSFTKGTSPTGERMETARGGSLESAVRDSRRSSGAGSSDEVWDVPGLADEEEIDAEAASRHVAAVARVTGRLASRLEESVAQAGGSIRRIEAQIDASVAEMEQKLESVSQRMEGISRVTQERFASLERLLARADGVEARLSSLTSRVERAGDFLDEKLRDISRVSQAADTARAALESAVENAGAVLKDADARMKKSREMLEARIERAGTSLDEKVREISDASQAADTARAALESAVAVAGTVWNDADARVKTWRESLEDVHESATAAIKDVKAHQKALMQVVEQARGAHRALHEKYEISTDLLAGLAKEREQVEALSCSIQEIQEAQEGLDRITAVSERNEAVLQAVTEGTARAERAISEIKEAYATAEEVRGRLAADLSRAEVATNRNKELEELCRQSEQMVSSLQAQGEAGRAALGELRDATAASNDSRKLAEAGAVRMNQMIQQLGSHHAAATAVVNQLAEATKESHEVMGSFQQVHAQADECAVRLRDVLAGAESVTQIAETRAVELAASATDAGNVGAKLDGMRTSVSELLKTVEDRVGAAGLEARRLEQGCAQAGKLVSRLGRLGEILAQAREMESAVRGVVERGEQVRAELQGTANECRADVNRLDEINNAARSLIEAHEQVRRGVLESVEDLTAQLEQTRATELTARDGIREFLAQAEQITRQLDDLGSRASALEARITELCAQPETIAAEAREQALRLERVCVAVRRVFGELSAKSLEAVRQAGNIEAVGIQAGERTRELTARTQAAAEVMQHWVNEAVQVHKRLERAIRKSPTVDRTHPVGVLEAVAKSVAGVGSCPADTLPEEGLRRLQIPEHTDPVGAKRGAVEHSSVSQGISDAQADASVGDSSAENISREDRISRIIEEAKRARSVEAAT